jgi:hypothetical protein
MRRLSQGFGSGGGWERAHDVQGNESAGVQGSESVGVQGSESVGVQGSESAGAQGSESAGAQGSESAGAQGSESESGDAPCEISACALSLYRLQGRPFLIPEAFKH